MVRTGLRHLERFPIRCRHLATAMRDVVRALLGEEEGERGVDQRADLFKRAGTDGAQECLQSRKREFDRIEVGTVGRQEVQARPGLFDRRPDLGLLCTARLSSTTTSPGRNVGTRICSTPHGS